jgi:hypothetical protein
MARVYSPRVAVRVLGAGVCIRLATETEAEAVEGARHGRDLVPEPSGSYRYREPDRPLAHGEVYIVSQAFVDIASGVIEDRWESYEHHGDRVSTLEDATLPLLAIADKTAEDLIELLGDMRIAGLDVSRWELMSAPRRVELGPELEARLAPRRRG